MLRGGPVAPGSKVYRVVDNGTSVSGDAPLTRKEAMQHFKALRNERILLGEAEEAYIPQAFVCDGDDLKRENAIQGKQVGLLTLLCNRGNSGVRAMMEKQGIEMIYFSRKDRWTVWAQFVSFLGRWDWESEGDCSYAREITATTAAGAIKQIRDILQGGFSAARAEDAAKKAWEEALLDKQAQWKGFASHADLIASEARAQESKAQAKEEARREHWARVQAVLPTLVVAASAAKQVSASPEARRAFIRSNRPFCGEAAGVWDGKLCLTP